MKEKEYKLTDKVDEDLINEVKGIIEVLCELCCHGGFVRNEEVVSGLYYTVNILREKYYELLSQAGYLERDDEPAKTIDAKDSMSII